MKYKRRPGAVAGGENIIENGEKERKERTPLVKSVYPVSFYELINLARKPLVIIIPSYVYKTAGLFHNRKE